MPEIEEQPEQEDSSLKRPSQSQDNQQSQSHLKQRYCLSLQVLVNKILENQAKEKQI